jgi:alanyl-tRNA synthetase
VTCFIGDSAHGIPRDNETAEVWQKLFAEHNIEAKLVEIGSAKDGDQRGIKPGERIFFYNDAENWWSRNGGIATTPKGDPCGPDNEVFYDFGEANHDKSFGQSHPASDGGRFMEICNKVWMQYRRNSDGSFSELDKGKVDFGGGLSRLAAAVGGSPDIFLTDLYQPIIAELEKLSGSTYADDTAAMRIIADHLTGAVWLASQGLTPSNKEQGYVLRRLVRRAIMKAFNLGIEEGFSDLVPIVIDIYADSYPELKKKSADTIAVLNREEAAFRRTLGRGLREFDRLVGQPNYDQVDDEALIASRHIMTGIELFKLQDTYGFPLELSLEEAQRRGIQLPKNWQAEFDKSLERQRQMSQTASKGEFKGGLTGDSLMHKKYHTATHLLGAALRQVLQSEASQRGANINDERLRLDFVHPEKLTPEQLKAVEDLVNQKIAEDLPVSFAEYDTNYAFDTLHAIGEFRDKYDDKVIVYTIGDPARPVSVDICGGPHVTHTGELGHFKITKEESSSAGVRRIKAILE